MNYLSSFKQVPLGETSFDCSGFPPLSNEQKALLSQLVTLLSRLDIADNAIALNDVLRPNTFAAGAIPSEADIIAFPEILKFAKSIKSTDEIARFRHILRYVDLIQHTLVDAGSDALSLDLDTVMAREIKEKKKPAKKDAAVPASAASAAALAPVPASAPTSEKTPTDGQRKEPSEEEKKAKAEAQKAKKAARAKAKAEQNANQPQAAPTIISPSMVDIRVGFIQKCVKHPDADSLYMSTIDMGDKEGPRTVCSGLVKHIPIEDMQERYVVCIANLKPVAMRGVKSCAMVLCASNEDKVEFVNVPAGSQPGDKLFFEGYDGEPEKQLNPKKKIWEALQPNFTTSSDFEVTYTAEGKPPAKLVNAKGELCHNSTIVGAKVN